MLCSWLEKKELYFFFYLILNTTFVVNKAYHD